MQPLHALKTPFFVSYLTIVNTGIGTRKQRTLLSTKLRGQPPELVSEILSIMYQYYCTNSPSATVRIDSQKSDTSYTTRLVVEFAECTE